MQAQSLAQEVREFNGAICDLTHQYGLRKIKEDKGLIYDSIVSTITFNGTLLELAQPKTIFS